MYKELHKYFDLNEVTYTGKFVDLATMNSIVLYKPSPSYTSNKTEELVIKVTEDFNTLVTTIMIAHRISSLRNCDSIIELDIGKIEREGKSENINS